MGIAVFKMQIYCDYARRLDFTRPSPGEHVPTRVVSALDHHHRAGHTVRLHAMPSQHRGSIAMPRLCLICVAHDGLLIMLVGPCHKRDARLSTAMYTHQQAGAYNRGNAQIRAPILKPGSRCRCPAPWRSL